MIEKVSEFSEKVEGEFEDLIRFAEVSLKKLWDNKKDEIWNKYLVK